MRPMGEVNPADSIGQLKFPCLARSNASLLSANRIRRYRFDASPLFQWWAAICVCSSPCGRSRPLLYLLETREDPRPGSRQLIDWITNAGCDFWLDPVVARSDVLDPGPRCQQVSGNRAFRSGPRDRPYAWRSLLFPRCTANSARWLPRHSRLPGANLVVDACAPALSCPGYRASFSRG
jgi:hypothetical protein